MSRGEAITLTKGLFSGLLLGSLLSAILPLSAITACILVAIVLFVLIVAPRSDIVYALVGVIIGALIAFFTGVKFDPSELTALALVAAVTWM